VVPVADGPSQDINNSGDGGIYAELIRNRAFQYSDAYPVSLDAWHPINGAQLKLERLAQPLSKALPVSMSVTPGTSRGPIGFYNDGYWGMSVKRQKYTGSFWVHGSYKGHFTASLQSALTDETFGSVRVASKATPGKWVEHEFELFPIKDAPNGNNTFTITFDPAVRFP
jgi:alpha-N-arabinofuranosidase